MMAKYQVVFLRLETAVQSLAKVKNRRMKLILQRAFSKYRANAKKAKYNEQNKSNLILKKVKGTVSGLVQICGRKLTILFTRYLGKLRLHHELTKHSTEIEHKLKELAENHKKENTAKDQAMGIIEQKLQQKAAEMIALKGSETLLKDKLIQKDEQERALKEVLDKFRKAKPEAKKAPKVYEEKVKELENKIKALENENKTLKDEWDATETNVESFVREISEMMETQEFASNIEALTIYDRTKTGKQRV